MPKRKVLVSSEKIVVNGLSVIQWTKVCPVCKKEYKTTSRHQRYCSDACAQKAAKKSRTRKKFYDENAEVLRLSAQAHSIGVRTLTILESMGLLEHKCSACGCTEGLQAHHISTDWLDNRPSNLQWLCTKCHAAAHSEISKNSTEDSLYVTLGDSYPILSKIIKK